MSGQAATPYPRWLAVLGGLGLAACSGGGVPAPAAPVPRATPERATPAGDPAHWELIFSDEFELPGAPDPTRWTYDLGYVANREAQFYTDRRENARVENGALVIEARKEPFQGYSYTSARLETQGIAHFLYGRVEVRAKLPTGRGTWPAIWMLGADIDRVGWPACGEIDIMENVGFDPLTIVGSVHTAAYNHVQNTQRNGVTTLPDPAPWEDFHVYALEWYPDRIEVSADGQVYFTFRNEGTGERTWPFDEPHFLILNLAIGGDWGGQQGVDDSLLPHRLVVDYVRVYGAP
jgi:beta-glucanase (GH16 family)